MQNERTIFFRKLYTSIDRTSMLLIILLIIFGIICSPTATMPFAVKRNMPYLLYAKQHIAIACFSIFLVVGITLMHEEHVKILAMIGYVFCICAMLSTFVVGVNIKGARRWVKIFGFSIQPSEFLKPITTVMSAYLISQQYEVTNRTQWNNSRDVPFYLRYIASIFVNTEYVQNSVSVHKKKVKHINVAPYIFLSFISITISAVMLILQPDFGMAFLLFTCYVSQLFVAGISLGSVFIMLCASVCFSYFSYVLLPHVRDRVDAFVSGSGASSYQITKALQAVRGGGFLGKGAGNGTVKQMIPDMHADFVLSVMAEEFGVITCLAILTIFLVIVTRSMIKVLETKDMFKILTVFGLSIQILTQVFVSFGSSMGIIPTKGITLPFFSYGGSSILSAAMSFGLIMCFTKRCST